MARSNSNQRNPLEMAAEMLAPFDPWSLLAKIGGLQLLTENASQICRLEAIAHVALSMPTGHQKPRITESKLRTILNLSPFATGLSPLEDPIESPFTEPFAFYRGTFLVLAGFDKEISFVLSHLLKALFLHPAPLTDSQFLRTANSVTAGILCTSDVIARRAGLRRWLATNSVLRGPVTIPDKQRVNELARCVTFQRDEFALLISDSGGNISDLRDLMIPLGTLELTSWSPDTGPLTQRPFALLRDGLLVAAPTELLSALVSHIVSLAINRGDDRALTGRYSDAIWNSVTESLFLTSNYPLLDSLEGMPEPAAKVGLFGIDTDKALCAVLFSDSLEGFGSDDDDNRWPRPLRGSLQSCITELERAILKLAHPPREVLFLIIFQHLAPQGACQLEFPHLLPGSASLMLTACELQTISRMERGDHLALWKFAKGSERAHRKQRIMTLNTLDDFHLYHRSGHSYYVSDEHFDLINTIPDEGCRLKQEFVDKHDPHPVLSTDAQHIVEVYAAHEHSIPIYAPRPDLTPEIQFLVEGVPVLIWVVTSKVTQTQATLVHAEITEAVAYWLWQLSDSLNHHLRSLASDSRAVVIRLAGSAAPEIGSVLRTRQRLDLNLSAMCP